MVATLRSHAAMGLAANQVGFRHSVFALAGQPSVVAFNPKIVWTSNEVISLEEGCLSFPGLLVRVKRPKDVRIRFKTPNGEVHTKLYTGMTASTIQHEMDHLAGRAFFHGMSRAKLERAVDTAKKIGYTYNLGILVLASRTNE